MCGIGGFFWLSRSSSDNAHDTREARLALSPHRQITSQRFFRTSTSAASRPTARRLRRRPETLRYRSRYRNKDRSSRAVEERRTLATLIASRCAPESVFSNIPDVRGKTHTLMPQIKADVTSSGPLSRTGVEFGSLHPLQSVALTHLSSDGIGHQRLGRRASQKTREWPRDAS
jgi:hypothetical protein